MKPLFKFVFACLALLLSVLNASAQDGPNTPFPPRVAESVVVEGFTAGSADEPSEERPQMLASGELTNDRESSILGRKPDNVAAARRPLLIPRGPYSVDSVASLRKAQFDLQKTQIGLPGPSTGMRALPSASAGNRKRSLPLILSGLALIGGGTALMATHAEKHVVNPNALSEDKTGTVPCVEYTYSLTGGSGTSSRNTTCSYKTVMGHSGAFKGGAVTVSVGGLLSLIGLIKR
jgi:hypothetical protein